MFFRRMFTRKDSINANSDNDNDNDIDDDNDEGDVDELLENSNIHDKIDIATDSNAIQRHHQQNHYQQHQQQRKYGTATAPTAGTATKHCNSVTTLHRAATSGPAVVQLTPLWEHILRTRTLPDTICPVKVFGEFLERLRDPEWQVRQHALRVLVDVLVVMRSTADAFMDPLIPQLVENLGHQAPTVRKGALDCLRVYLAETAMPETILLQILDIGLNQKITNEPFGGRLTCGVMLSLPALVQSTLHTSKRHFILRTTIDMLVQKMGQVTHQEITLKVLLKIRELIGEREFVEYMTHGAYREFELLCNVYGVNAKSTGKGGSLSSIGNVAGSWRLLASQQRHQEQLSQSQALQSCWRSSDEEQMLEGASQGKVIMETEIKINDDTLTMRILEAKDEDCVETETDSLSPRKSQDSYPQSLEDEVVCGRLVSAKSNERDVGGVIRLLSDSDLEESSPQDDDGNKEQNAEYFTVVTPSTPSRTPKRVTFGGEVVKMRTPDSDATSSNNNHGSNNNNNNGINSHQNPSTLNQNSIDLAIDSGDTNTSLTPPNNSIAMTESKTTILNLDIPNDNTKPLPRPRTAQQSPKREPQPQTQTSHLNATNQETTSPATSSAFTNSPHSPVKRRDSNISNSLSSPKSPFKRISVSPVDSIISPKAPHKATEMLHNLQRDPSPVRARSGAAARRASIREESIEEELLKPTVYSNQGIASERRKEQPTPPPPKSWEDLNIVDYDSLLDLRSGDWRLRLQGIVQVEEALRSPENLALVQPCLDSLLRTLLSSERNQDVGEAKRQLLMNLISRLPLDNLEDRTVQIMTGLCRQGGAGPNRVCKALMHRLPAATIVLKLLSIEFLHAKSSRFREHALQMAMYALMTFPSTCYDTTTCVTSATYAALNRKRRVRQAALDVLAILGKMTTARTIMEVVQSVGATRDDGDALVAAVRARLLRKQLPLVTADGLVQYTLRLPSPPQPSPQSEHDRDDGGGGGQLGPDIEWITAGVGSVSPTSLKRRAQRHRSCTQQSFRCLPHHYAGEVAGGGGGSSGGGSGCGGGMGSASGSNNSDDSTSRRHSYRSPPEPYGNVKDFSGNDDTHSYNLQHMLGSSMPLHFGVASSKKSNVADYSSYLSRRMVAKSCSDSSMDGRSSDSTYTNSSSGGGSGSGAAIAAGCVAANTRISGISGRFTRQTVNSRFPAMDRMDLNATYMRVHKPPTYYPGMGAYAHLQQQQYNMSSTYPKINYTMPMQQQHRRRSQQQQQQQQQHQEQQQQRYIQQQKGNNYNAQENIKHMENLDKEQSNGASNDGNGGGSAGDGGSSDNLDGTYTIYSDIPSGAAAADAGVTTSNDTTMDKVSNNQQQQQISNVGSSVRRFVNVDKFIMQSNKSSQTNGTATAEMPATVTATNSEPNATPISMKSTTYSQKSTASAQSNNIRSNSDSERKINDSLTGNAGKNRGSRNEEAMTIQNDQQHKEEETINYSSPATTLVGTLKEMASSNEVNSESPTKWATGEEVLDIEDIVDAVTETVFMTAEAGETPEADTLKRNGSVLSLLSKTESIKTQLEDTPPTLSRAQSVKSLVIEEDLIDDNGSFVVVEEVIEELVEQQPNIAMNIGAEEELTADSKQEEDDEGNDNYDQDSPVYDENFAKNQATPKSRPPSRHHSPTIAELKILSRRNSMIKSMESLYERPPSKQDSSLDNTTTSNTSTDSQASSQLKTIIPIKPQHTPLKQKSKTSHFLKNNNNRRRISPVKQAIKMTQAELYPPTLTRFEKPREALLKTFDQLDASNWEIIMLGLKSMVRLMRYHPEYLENQMHMLCIQLTRSVRNLRSQVARAACQAATELFTLKSKVMEQECDDLVCALLHRSADTNRFLRSDATRALESMSDNLTPAKILNILTTKGAQHQNAVVRTTAAKLLFRLVERLGCDKVFQMPRDNRDKLFVTGANLLMEGSLETRGYAKSLFRLLSNHHNYNRLLLEVIPTRTYRNVEKTLKSIQR